MRNQQATVSWGALWAILWRAVVFFPLAMVLTVLPWGILLAGGWLVGSALAFGLAEQWAQAALYLAGLPVVVLMGRFYARWVAKPLAAQDQRDGALL